MDPHIPSLNLFLGIEKDFGSHIYSKSVLVNFRPASKTKQSVDSVYTEKKFSRWNNVLKIISFTLSKNKTSNFWQREVIFWCV